MRISIIPQDNRIIVDGKTVDLDDNDIRWKFDDDHIHAIQWKDDKGEIEYEDIEGEDPLPNKILGEDDFDTVIRPYINFFNEFLTLAEKRELQLAFEEEERVANEINELNISKLQEEENIVIINDLQDQNKKVREEYDKIADELEKVLEEKSISERELKLQHEIELHEKSIELQNEENKKIDEYFRQKSSEFSDHIENLVEQLENQKEEFLEEKKQFALYMQKFKSSIEEEVDDMQKTLVSERRQREIADEISEKQKLADEEQILLMRQSSDLEKQTMELELEELSLERTRLLRKRRLEMEQNNLEHEQLDAEREKMLLDVAIRREPDLIDKIDNDEKYALIEWQSQEGTKIQEEYLEKQREKFDEYVEERYDAYQDMQRHVKEIKSDPNEVKISDLTSIFDEVDPEDFYAYLTDYVEISLTDEEKESNGFPVQKANAWFNKLKQIIHDTSENADDEDEQ